MLTFNPNIVTPRRLFLHQHPFYELGLVLSGRCYWELREQAPLELSSGEAILLKPGTVHSERTALGEKAGLAWVGFEFGGLPPEWCNQPISMGEDFTEIANCFHIISREHRFSDLISQTRVKLVLQSLVVLIARRAQRFEPPPSPVSGLNPRQVRCVESAAHYFRTNLKESLSISQVAAYHSLCPAHFSSLFRQYHLVNPRTYMREARLEQVGTLLTTSELPLKEIAAECGFVDAAHLCKAFKDKNRETPHAFRSRIRMATSLDVS